MVANLTEMLRRDEGEKLFEYKDSLGYSTIGVGRLIDARKGGGITKEESAYLLTNDIRAKSAEVMKALPWAAALGDVRFAVLVAMAFQLGTQGLLEFKNTLQMMKSGDYAGASQGMLNSLWYKQTPQRVSRMAQQMRTGEWV